MFIEELHLSSFKGFHDYSLRCSQFTTLIGLNNSGKTSILHAVQLLHDIYRFAFGNKQTPDFSRPQLDSDPSNILRRMSYDPDAIWLNKKTSDPCKISAKFANEIEV